jgi:hypothetical protein
MLLTPRTNQTLNSCTTMTLNGINVVCPCDEIEYSFVYRFRSGISFKNSRTELSGVIARFTSWYL